MDDCFPWFVYICIYIARFVGNEKKNWRFLILRDKAWFTQLLQIALIVCVLIVGSWMGYKWGSKHMNCLSLWYAQTLFCCYHGYKARTTHLKWNVFSILGRRLFHFCPNHGIMKWTRRVCFILHVNRLVVVSGPNRWNTAACSGLCACVMMTTRGQNRQNSAKSDCKLNDMLYKCLTDRLSAVCE